MDDRVTIAEITDDSGDTQLEIHAHPGTGSVEITVTDRVEAVNIYFRAEQIARLRRATRYRRRGGQSAPARCHQPRPVKPHDVSTDDRSERLET